MTRAPHSKKCVPQRTAHHREATRPSRGVSARPAAAAATPLRSQQRAFSKKSSQSAQSPAATKPLHECPPFTQRKAILIRLVLDIYLALIALEYPERTANTVARAVWLLLFGDAPNEKTIRRRADRVRAAGGRESAPMTAYVDRKSFVRGMRKPASPG